MQMDSASIQFTGKIISEHSVIILFKIGHRNHWLRASKSQQGAGANGSLLCLLERVWGYDIYYKTGPAPVHRPSPYKPYLMLIDVNVSCLLIINYMLALMDYLLRLGKRGQFVSAFDYSLLCGFCSERFPLTLAAKDRLRYFIVAFPGLSM